MITDLKDRFKDCGMGPWLVLVSPCFRENVVATCKIVSFLCSLDNLLQKNVIFSSLMWKKRAILDLLFTFFSHQGKVTKTSLFLQNFFTKFLFSSIFCLQSASPTSTGVATMKNAYQLIIHVTGSLIVVTTAMKSMVVRYFLVSLAISERISTLHVTIL